MADSRRRSTAPGNGDLVTTLLTQLAAQVGGDAGQSSQAASALQVCASEMRRVADQEKEGETHQELELLSTLLLEVALMIERSERRWSRLAFDLHDSVLQEIAALRLELHGFQSEERAREDPDAGSAERLGDFLRHVDGRLRAMDRGLRELIDSFDSPTLSRQPFEQSVRDYVHDFVASADVSVSLRLRGDFERLSHSQQIALFRILVEALANIRRHAGASRVWITMRVGGGEARLRIRDNGRGFDPSRVLRQAAKKRRWGVLGMSERARLLGGRFEIESKPDGPTTITVSIPAGRVVELPAPPRGAKRSVRR